MRMVRPARKSRCGDKRDQARIIFDRKATGAWANVAQNCCAPRLARFEPHSCRSANACTNSKFRTAVVRTTAWLDGLNHWRAALVDELPARTVIALARAARRDGTPRSGSRAPAPLLWIITTARRPRPAPRASRIGGRLRLKVLGRRAPRTTTCSPSSPCIDKGDKLQDDPGGALGEGQSRPSASASSATISEQQQRARPASHRARSVPSKRLRLERCAYRVGPIRHRPAMGNGRANSRGRFDLIASTWSARGAGVND